MTEPSAPGINRVRTGRPRKIVDAKKIGHWPERPVEVRDHLSGLEKSGKDRTTSKSTIEQDIARAKSMDPQITALIHKTLSGRTDQFIIPDTLLPTVRARIISMNTDEDSDTISYMVVRGKPFRSFVVITKYRAKCVAEEEMAKYRAGGYGKCCFIIGQYIGMLTNTPFANIIKETAHVRKIPLYLSLIETTA